MVEIGILKFEDGELLGSRTIRIVNYSAHTCMSKLKTCVTVDNSAQDLDHQQDIGT